MHSRALTEVFRDYLSSRRAPDGTLANHGVSVTVDPADPGTIKLNLTFKSGIRYCCSEAGCHLGLFKPTSWQRLRDLLRAAGIELQSPLRVRVVGSIENGAVFTNLGALGLPQISRAFHYEAELFEPGA
jgi:hypothetical protein